MPDDQLSLAIGREGQNARLAAKLTGWRIDIKSVTEAVQEMEADVSGWVTQQFPGTFAIGGSISGNFSGSDTVHAVAFDGLQNISYQNQYTHHLGQNCRRPYIRLNYALQLLD